MIKTFCAMYFFLASSIFHFVLSDYIFAHNIAMDTIVQIETQNQAEPEVVIKDYLEELKKLGFYKEDSSDKNLNKRNAVLRFQSSLNLTADGNFSDLCLKALKKRINDSEFTYPDKIIKPPTDKKWIVINKTKRTLTLYKNEAVIKKYPVAVGNPPSITPDGQYEIANKIVNPYWGGGGYTKPVAGGSADNPLGYRWIGISLNGGGRYGVHGNTSPYSIGTYASHGCVRMINSDVEELFELVDIKDPIWIGTDESLGKLGLKQDSYSSLK